MRKAALLLLATAVTAAGAAHAAAPPARTSLALRVADLPAGWRIASLKSVTNAQYAKKEQLPLSRVTGQFGRLTGADADYVTKTPSASGVFKGIVSASSGATVCRSAHGAHALYRWVTDPARIQHTVQSSTTTLHLVRVAGARRLGSESHLYRASFRSSGTALAIYVFLWRRGRIDAALLVGGVAAATGQDDAFRLASRLDRRIAPFSR